MKIVFHSHSNLSKDCDLSIEEITTKLHRLKIEGLILTDHNRLAFEKKTRINGVTIVPAEEIATKEGEVIGMFLKSEIPAGLSFTQTLEEIHRQKGLAIVPHPCDRFRTKVVTPEAVIKNIHDIDAIETFNARTVFGKDNDRAHKLAKQYRKPVIHGADAHLLSEYGPNWIEGVDISFPKAFLDSLEKAKFTSQKSSLFVHVATKFVKWKKKFKSN